MPVTFTAVLDGASEFPTNASTGSGFATVVFDTDAHTMFVDVIFADLLGLTTAAHIHCCTAVAGAGTAGVATMTPNFTGFPLGVSSGSFMKTFDMDDPSSFNATFVTNQGGTAAAAEAALFQGLLDGKAYFNIHTSLFGGGEIRGFLQQVPEPRTLALAGLGLLALAWSQRRRQASRAAPRAG